MSPPPAKMFIRRLFPFCLLVLLSVLVAGQAQAQLVVNVRTNKRVYVAYEPIIATVTVANRAGKDVVLGDHDGVSWLTLQVNVVGGDRLMPYSGTPRFEPRVLAKNAMVEQTVSLGHFYPLGGQDTYSVRASVFFPELGQSFVSNHATFRVSEGTIFWQEQIGLASERSGRSTYRRFMLLSFQEDDHMSLFVRLKDERSNRVLATYALGRLVPHRDPQATIDAQSRLHVLFLTGPRFYRHSVIGPNGVREAEEIYQTHEGRHPQLVVSNAGNVRVAGGQLFDPNQPPPEAREFVRRLTERPPGLPQE